MAWYYGEFSCGHEGRVNIIGPVKDRQWKADRKFSDPCEECWLERRDRKRKEDLMIAKQKCEEMELPELIGTEKQVAWAITLRQELIDKFNNFIDRNKENEKEWKELNWLYTRELDGVNIQDVTLIRDHIIENITHAKYFIDNRDERIVSHIEKNKIDALKSETEKAEDLYQEELLEREKIENTVYPENKITYAIAIIEVKEDEVKVSFEKDENFKKIVKDLGYKWYGAWKRKLSKFTGSYVDRAAELGNVLLAEGFPVLFPNREIKQKAIAGTFEQECARWIHLSKKGDYKGWLYIQWRGYNRNLYETARKIPGSKFDNGVVRVNVYRYLELEDFANICSFKFDNEATRYIEKYKELINGVEKVDVKKIEEVMKKDCLEDILKSNDEVLADLLDN